MKTIVLLLLAVAAIMIPEPLYSAPSYAQLVASADQFQRRFPPGKGPLRGFYDIGSSSRPLLQQIDEGLAVWRSSKDAQLLKGIVLLQAVIAAVDHAEPFSDNFLSLSASQKEAFDVAGASLPPAIKTVYAKRLSAFQGAAQGGF